MIVSPLQHRSIQHNSGSIVLAEGVLNASAPGERLLIAPWHIHHEHEEIFYVLEGAIGFGIDDDELVAHAGDAVLVAPGQAHTWWNAAEEPARYLMATPPIINDLITALHAGPLSWDETTRLFADHDSTVIGWER